MSLGTAQADVVLRTQGGFGGMGGDEIQQVSHGSIVGSIEQLNQFENLGLRLQQQQEDLAGIGILAEQLQSAAAAACGVGGGTAGTRLGDSLGRGRHGRERRRAPGRRCRQGIAKGFRRTGRSKRRRGMSQAPMRRRGGVQHGLQRERILLGRGHHVHGSAAAGAAGAAVAEVGLNVTLMTAVVTAGDDLRFRRRGHGQLPFYETVIGIKEPQSTETSSSTGEGSTILWRFHVILGLFLLSRRSAASLVTQTPTINHQLAFSYEGLGTAVRADPGCPRRPTPSSQRPPFKPPPTYIRSLSRPSGRTPNDGVTAYVYAYIHFDHLYYTCLVRRHRFRHTSLDLFRKTQRPQL
jgi:hypothetical protein